MSDKETLILPSYPDHYCEIGIRKVRNGYIVSYAGEVFVFEELKEIFSWIEAFYGKNEIK